MKINDNYLREQLKHVYWLNGGCCAGKTTMTRKFVEELGFQTLPDEVMRYRPFTDPEEYPALQDPHPGLNWDEWFNRPTDVKYQWLCDLVVEMMEFYVVDLLRMPTDRPIMIELGIMPEHILPFIPKERMICLYTSDDEIERLYFFREDHKMILDVINLTADPAATIKHANKTNVKFSNEITKACMEAGIKMLKRTPELSVEEQFRLVREHFGI
mgnify:CR=1 FL=1